METQNNYWLTNFYNLNPRFNIRVKSTNVLVTFFDKSGGFEKLEWEKRMSFTDFETWWNGISQSIPPYKPPF